jgi:hypothetical protein
MAELKIPEKWRDVYRQCSEFLAHPGEPSTKPIEWCVSLIEELALLEENIEIVVDNMPSESVVRIQEGGGFEDIHATLAVSVAKLSDMWAFR